MKRREGKLLGLGLTALVALFMKDQCIENTIEAKVSGNQVVTEASADGYAPVNEFIPPHHYKHQGPFVNSVREVSEDIYGIRLDRLYEMFESHLNGLEGELAQGDVDYIMDYLNIYRKELRTPIMRHGNWPHIFGLLRGLKERSKAGWYSHVIADAALRDFSKSRYLDGKELTPEQISYFAQIIIDARSLLAREDETVTKDLYDYVSSTKYGSLRGLFVETPFGVSIIKGNR